MLLRFVGEPPLVLCRCLHFLAGSHALLAAKTDPYQEVKIGKNMAAAPSGIIMCLISTCHIIMPQAEVCGERGGLPSEAVIPHLS